MYYLVFCNLFHIGLGISGFTTKVPTTTYCLECLKCVQGNKNPTSLYETSYRNHVLIPHLHDDKSPIFK